MNLKSDNKYFLSSFFWSTFSKVLNALLGFVSVPLLLGYFGKAEYGLLSIATACNGYMHLMDLGMNTGAIKFFSQWEAEGNRGMIKRVSRTNVTFYFIISIFNILGLLSLALWGEGLFSVTHEQFGQLKTCFVVLALFSSVSWITTAYSQLLTAYKKLDFTMKIQCVMVLIKCVLIASVFIFGLSLVDYFFYLTLIVSSAIIPYAIQCRRTNLIDTLLPATNWSDFKVVFTFSLSIFALSLFQVTATQSRPILLSIFSTDGAGAIADYRIIEVIPQFIITVCGTFTGIFLPKSADMIVQNSRDEIQQYVNNWTGKTTILVCILCFPFVIGAENIINAYVGSGYSYLGKWLQLWCLFLIVQMHSTPAFSFVLAYGKTKVLVLFTAIACILSMVVNVLLCTVIPIGSAIIGYAVYMLSLIGVYYIYIYRIYLKLNSWQIFLSFLKPMFIGVMCFLIPHFLNIEHIFGTISSPRLFGLFVFIIKTIIWFVPFIMILYFSNLLKTKR